MSYPYLQVGKQYFPCVDVEIAGPKASLTIKALVDSGASYSVFREEIADCLGIRLESGKALYLEGIGGRILGYLHKLPVMIGKRRFVGKIVFSREFRTSINIMGRDNLFGPFWITFKDKIRALEIAAHITPSPSSNSHNSHGC